MTVYKGPFATKEKAARYIEAFANPLCLYKVVERDNSLYIAVTKRRIFRKSVRPAKAEPPSSTTLSTQVKSGPKRDKFLILNTKIRGVTFKNSDGTSRQQIISRLKDTTPINLVRDYGNRHDRNAIKVINDKGEQLGWVAKEIARDLASKMDAGKQHSASITTLTGGGVYTMGVKIRIKVCA